MRERLGEGPRSDVLRCLLENFGERIRLGSRKPVPDDVLVSSTAEEHRPRLTLTCHRCLNGFGVLSQRLGGPTAVIEATTGVFVRAPRRLHYSIEGEVLDNDELAHWSSLPCTHRCWFCWPTRALTVQRPWCGGTSSSNRRS